MPPDDPAAILAALNADQRVELGRSLPPPARRPRPKFTLPRLDPADRPAAHTTNRTTNGER